jgi:hypothetical protein
MKIHHPLAVLARHTQTNTDKRPYPLVDTPADKLSVPLGRVLFLPCHVGRAKCPYGSVANKYIFTVMEYKLGASIPLTEKYSNRSLLQAQLLAKLACQKSFILRWHGVRIVRK